MKIAIVSPTIPPINFIDGLVGGAENYAASLSLALSKLRHSVTIITSSNIDSYYRINDYLDIIRLKTYFLPGSALFFPTNSLKTIMVNQFDVVHVNQIFTGLNVHFCGLAKLKQIPCFATDHGGGELFFRAISRVCANLPDSFISVSRYSSEYLQHLAPNKKSFIAYGGVDTTLFNPDYDVAFLRDFLGLREYKVVLCVGRLLSCKGFDIVIKAFYKLPKNTKLIIVGPIFDQTYFAYLKELARPLGSRVIFIGQVPDSDLPKYYNLCDIFVRASVNFDCFGHKYNFPELLGLVKFEAMACGKPVVVSDVGGLPEQVIDGKHGYVVKAGSDVMLANALLVLLSDDDLRKQMGMNSYKFVRKYFSWRSIAENVIRFYNGG